MNEIISWSVAAVAGSLMFLLRYQSLAHVRCDLKKFWNRYQRLIVIVSTLLFGAMHITNYESTKNLILFSPVVLVTYLIAGLLIGI